MKVHVYVFVHSYETEMYKAEIENPRVNWVKILKDVFFTFKLSFVMISLCIHKRILAKCDEISSQIILKYSAIDQKNGIVSNIEFKWSCSARKHMVYAVGNNCGSHKLCINIFTVSIYCSVFSPQLPFPKENRLI